MAVKLHSAEIIGLSGHIIDVELDVSQGLRSFTIVGLADKAVDEARERISYAVQNIGLNPPHKKNQRVIVSLAPADLKKEGPIFDLPIALAYLSSSRQLSFRSEDKIFLGELALNGELRPVRGILPLAEKAKKAGFKEIYVPFGNGAEAALIEGIDVYESKNLLDIVGHLKGAIPLSKLPKTEILTNSNNYSYDLSDIRGQETAKRALVIAAAGGHNVAMSGPPGTGKTLLARALPSILPPLSSEEALEVTAIHSVVGALDGTFVTERPFRTPHHTSSYVALVGGGVWPRPGEITLAHRGVLFCDEFPEFDRRVIEALRQPLEDGSVTVSRSRGTVKFPARFTLVAAMNPCPCGNLGSKTKACVCSPSGVFRYQRKISGPIADRIDLWMEVGQIKHEELDKKIKKDEGLTKRYRDQIIKAREIQKKRFENTPFITNNEMHVKEIEKFCVLSDEARVLLLRAAKNLDLSPRAYHRIIKLARTIADLDACEKISEGHIAEALQYRPRQNLL
ncbi:MAG: magnesium chelatase [Candidatus Niyogibacteria bacterium CG10_big_fil_rev_8_21_14_0_10_42_19]|uniref:Magnesium chelatase n=1 Tax=Candidatus Niyogibacteria bacterium CG10_big_fil_rev_8_21_14_0_10_42_19 TaxID=1974725 RepID=A0A2H0TH33_9BACT|nr:MAG: magnesium chelatase [Candidatus Niyogibacteria bacterium CG10_big_fil_rev_8_21_14_0_10_42_19]